MRKRLSALALAVVTALSLAACGGQTGGTSTSGSSDTQAAASSGQTIKIVCPYGVGGTADAIARKYAVVANKHSDYNFIVENMTGGDGFQAANWYTDQDPSTTDLLVYGFGVAYRHDLGKTYQTEVVDFDRNDIYPVADIDDRTWMVYAKAGTTLADVLEKAKNGGIKMSGGNPLSDPHLALGSLLALEGGTVMTVPYDGGAAQKKGLTDGEVDVFVGTTQAAIEDVEAGTIVPILAFAENTMTFKGPDGDIVAPGVGGEGMAPELDPSKDYSGSILPGGGFIAVRTGADQAWIDEIIEISKAVWADPEYSDWISEIMLNRNELYGEDAKAFEEEGCAKALAAFKLLSGQQ
ncbi:MAG: tripartite tricarboxylate transporter substrate-binding protein [Eubacteriales bacterium]|nr:tripartite tricarboxylate transporter substrate-binding protein [Eubacteriales bacterium]